MNKIFNEYPLEKVIELDRICFEEECWNKEQISNHTLIHKILVLEKNSIPVSFTFYLETIDEFEILKIGTKPEFRGNSLAGILIDYIFETIGKKTKPIFLEVKESNLIALNLYKKKGFQKIGIRKNYYPNKENAILLKKAKHE